MVDRRSSINYINQKYHGVRPDAYVPTHVDYNQTNIAPVIAHNAVPDLHVVDHHTDDDTPVPDHHQVHAHSKGFRLCGCPWWLCLLLTLLGLLLIGVLIGFFTGVLGNKKEHVSTTVVNENQSQQVTTGTEGQVNGGTVEKGCNPGFFAHNGKCISCPEGSTWNGENCVKNASHLSVRRLH